MDSMPYCGKDPLHAHAHAHAQESSAAAGHSDGSQRTVCRRLALRIVER